MEAVLERTLAARRFQMRLMLAFAGAGLLLACIGVYAVVSAGVARRTPEFAVRLALGATSRDIVRAVLREGLRPVLAGLIAGAAGGMAAAAYAASLLFGVTPYEPVAVAVAVAIIAIVSVAACLGPAVRALRTDPMQVLRRA
jgi:ABC-type antimicrobial peptide transport system permease subunit